MVNLLAMPRRDAEQSSPIAATRTAEESLSAMPRWDHEGIGPITAKRSAEGSLPAVPRRDGIRRNGSKPRYRQVTHDPGSIGTAQARDQVVARPGIETVVAVRDVKEVTAHLSTVKRGQR